MLFPPASPQKTYFFFFLFIMALVPSFTTHETTGTAPFAAPFATTTPASTVSLAACTIPLLTFFPASLLMASLKASATLGGSVSTSSSLSSNLGRGKEGRSVSFPCAGPLKKKKRERERNSPAHEKLKPARRVAGAEFAGPGRGGRVLPDATAPLQVGR
uniref:Uncharacterized protein n=1 Tax=Chloropicon roscoffensis TaxID=1461544 RepID=A0A7S3FSC5_9CHLO